MTRTIPRPWRVRRGLLLGAFAVALSTRATAQQAIPARLSDEAFWRMVVDFSEPGGSFRSDNFVSNEIAFQYVIPELKRITNPGGIYVGVGPDQNFTYIVAMQPKISFVIDIRRQNMLQHLLYKALLEQSADRAEFLSRLFSRPRPSGLDASSTVDALFQAFNAAAPDSALYQKNFAAVKDRLVRQHHFTLSQDDLRAIEYVYSAFFSGGPDLTYSFGTGRGQYGGRWMPTYGELMVESDGQGERRSYLANEENYRKLAEMERNNLIVPLVGDFGGDKAIRAVGSYLREHGTTVTAFYTSNVEQYLFQSGDAWRKFFTNVGTMPLDSSSLFIRAVFNNVSFRYQPSMTPGPRSVTMLCSIQDLLKAVNDGAVQSYFDVIQLSR
jgi:hypothetical protein